MSFMSYQGSKKREIKYIKQWEPDNFNKVVDVFGGSGSVSFAYIDEVKEIYYNDLEPNVYLTFKTMKDKKETEDMINKFKTLSYTEDEYYKIWDSPPSAVRNLYVGHNSIMGMRGRCVIKRKNKEGEIKPVIRSPNIKNILLYQDKVERLNISNEDYKVVLNKYKDDEGAFIYCDPPYLSKTSKGYAGSIAEFVLDDLDWIVDYMRDKDTKCKVMLNIDYTGHTRENYSDLYRSCYPIAYGSRLKNNLKKNIYTKYHLFLTNYTKAKIEDIKEETKTKSKSKGK